MTQFKHTSQMMVRVDTQLKKDFQRLLLLKGMTATGFIRSKMLEFVNENKKRLDSNEDI